MAGFNIMDILNNKTTAAAEAEDFAPIRLNYKEIIVTKHNKYSIDDSKFWQREFICLADYSSHLLSAESTENTDLCPVTEDLQRLKFW